MSLWRLTFVMYMCFLIHFDWDLCKIHWVIVLHSYIHSMIIFCMQFWMTDIRKSTHTYIYMTAVMIIQISRFGVPYPCHSLSSISNCKELAHSKWFPNGSFIYNVIVNHLDNTISICTIGNSFYGDFIKPYSLYGNN